MNSHNPSEPITINLFSILFEISYILLSSGAKSQASQSHLLSKPHNHRRIESSPVLGYSVTSPTHEKVPFANHPHHDRGILDLHSFIYASLIFYPQPYDLWIAICIATLQADLDFRLEIWKTELHGYHPSSRNKCYFSRYKLDMSCYPRTWYQCQIPISPWKFFGMLTSLKIRCCSLQLCSYFYFLRSSIQYSQVGFP